MRKSRAQGTNVPPRKPIPRAEFLAQLPKSQPICWYCGNAAARYPWKRLKKALPVFFCSPACAVSAGMEAAEELVQWDPKIGDWKVVARADRLATGRKLSRVESQDVKPLVDITPMTPVPQKAINAIDRVLMRLGDEQQLVALEIALDHAKARRSAKGVDHA